MGEIVEHQPAHGDLLDVEHAGGFGQMFEQSVVGVKRQRDVSLEAVGFVLQRAQFDQVVDAVFVVLYVTVEHGGVRLQPDLMRQARGIEPLIAVDFVVADDVADAVGEDFGASAGKGVDAGGFQLFEGFADRKPGAPGKICYFHHGEGLEVDLREALLEPRTKVQEVLKGKIGVQTSDDVELGDGVGVAGSGGSEGLFERHGVGAGRILLASGGAEAAGGDTDIGRVDVTIDVKVGFVAVQALAHGIGQPAHGENIGRAVKNGGVGGI